MRRKIKEILLDCRANIFNTDHVGKTGEIFQPLTNIKKANGIYHWLFKGSQEFFITTIF